MPARSRPSTPPFLPRISRPARPLLARIGLPESTPFKADPFQKEAVRLAVEDDVLVSAPTGSGKTWIAEQAMDRVLAFGGRCWYASPLKALSNAKLLEFSQTFGPDRVGILTGDRKENSGAPVIVGTTEILRNQLYDAMARGEDFRSDLVVLDEAHYLADEERGVVWEEVIIYLPSRVRLLLLSATLANAVELADWLFQVRGQPCRVVEAGERPVPLEPLFLAPDGEIWPLIRGGRLAPHLEHLLRKPAGLSRSIPLGRTLTGLEELDLLPAIFFLTSRADCDQALAFCRSRPKGRWAGGLAELNRIVDDFLGLHPFLRSQQTIGFIRCFAVASHHAGHLPHLKILVEKLMQAGLLRAIFSTSTVAAGVNFPARTVVLSQSDRFNGRDFQNLTSTELTQMTGRAGRRGMDRVGFALFVPGPHQDLRLVADILQAPPEPIEGRMHLSFGMILNLLLSHSPEEVKPLLSLSLATFQAAGRTEEVKPRYLDRLAAAIGRGGCGDLESAIFQRRRQMRLEQELKTLETGWEELEEQLRLKGLLHPGRLFLDDRHRPWMVMRKAESRGREGVLAVRPGPRLKLYRGRLRLKFLGLERVAGVSRTVVELAPDKELLRTLRRLPLGKLEPAGEDQALDPELKADLDRAKSRLEELKSALAASPCSPCLLREDCLADPGSDLSRDLRRAEAWLERLESERRRLWLSFLDRLEFLKAEGFVDPAGELTEEGRWAAGLRLEHPLIIAQAIGLGALPAGRPEIMAGLMAPFVLDRERAWPTSTKGLDPEPELVSAFRELEARVEPLARRQREAGFERPTFRFAPALAVFRWAGGRSWDEVIGAFGVEPGDMAALVFRTADNLRQVAGLKKTHPALAAASSQARERILREPVTVPV